MGTLATPTQVLAAASTAVARLLDAPARTGCVVAVLPMAVHLATGEEGLPLVCIATADAVRLPCSLVVPTLPRASVGDRVVLGGGRLVIGDAELTPTRWWPPARPQLRDHLARQRAVALPLAAAGPVRAVLDAGGSLTELAPALLGLGPGLTPAGDDVLAGALVTLRAAADPAGDRLAAAIAAADPVARTTTVSAALLIHAARGECVPELAKLLDALDGRAELPAALAKLLGVGATSGAALAAGVRLALVGTAATR